MAPVGAHRRPLPYARPLHPLTAVYTAVLLLAQLPTPTTAHHMDVIPPQNRKPTAEGAIFAEKATADDTILKIENNCPETVWPSISTQSGGAPSKNGFELETGSVLNLTVSENWQGRIWGRTNCSFNDDGTGPSSGSGKACKTGDCNGQLDCKVGGDTPVSLAEFTLDAGDGQTYYDISLVDGYNLPMAIVVQPSGSNNSITDIPPNLTNPSCQGTASLLAEPDFSPYTQEDQQQLFLGTSSKFPLPFENSTSASKAARWCPWDLQVFPPDKPGDNVYPYPDDNIPRPPFSPCFSACTKWGQASDCCTRGYNSPSKCSPSLYSKNAKKVCPDAYSYAFDDQTSTFIIPSGAGKGFGIVFCPGGRSTNILTAEADQHKQLGSNSGGKNGHPAKRDDASSSSPQTSPSFITNGKTRGQILQEHMDARVQRNLQKRLGERGARRCEERAESACISASAVGARGSSCM